MMVRAPSAASVSRLRSVSTRLALSRIFAANCRFSADTLARRSCSSSRASSRIWAKAEIESNWKQKIDRCPGRNSFGLPANTLQNRNTGAYHETTEILLIVVGVRKSDRRRNDVRGGHTTRTYTENDDKSIILTRTLFIPSSNASERP